MYVVYMYVYTYLYVSSIRNAAGLQGKSLRTLSEFGSSGINNALLLLAYINYVHIYIYIYISML